MERLRRARGADWFPSWARSPVDYWNASFPLATAERELGFVAGLGLDHVRIWLSAWGWEADPDRYETNLRALFDHAASLDLGIVIELFDSCGVEPDDAAREVPIGQLPRLVDADDPRLALMNGLGGQPRDIFTSPAMVPVPFAGDPMAAVWEGFVPNPGYHWLGPEHWERWDAYAHAVLAAIGTHPALLMVELMNEPFVTRIGQTVDVEPIRAFYRHVHELVRTAVPAVPISIGAPNPEQFAIHDGDVGGDLDVVSFHPLGDADRTRADIAAAREVAGPRPLYASEWGHFPGGDDATQCAAFETILPVLDDAGIGWAVTHLIAGYGPFGLTAILYPSGIMRPAARLLREHLAR